MMNKSIKVKSTTYPENQPTEQEWFKEFRIGIMIHDKPNGFGMTFNDHIKMLKEMTPDEENRDFAGQTNS